MTSLLNRILSWLRGQDEAAPKPAPAQEEQPMVLAWGKHVSPAFRAKVYRICDELGWGSEHPSWLMACMAFETGRAFRSDTRNPWSSATGLIQFMAATARGLGTSTRKLAAMDEVAQLDYVRRYFEPYAERIRSLEDMYMAILWPRGIAKPLEYILWKTGTRAYAVNRGLDKDRDGDVSKAEAAQKVREQLTIGMRDGNVWIGD